MPHQLHRAFGIDVSTQNDPEPEELNPKINLEVIGLGLPRTGTTSLSVALIKLGFAPTHGGIHLFRSMQRTEDFIDLYAKVLSGAWRAGDQRLINRLRELMRGYRSSTNVPISPLVQEIFPAYPMAKYILTTKPGGGDEWYKSIWATTSWHFRRDWWRTWFRFCIAPVYFLRRTDDKVQQLYQRWRWKYGSVGPQVYDSHTSEVHQMIPRSQLLEYDVRDGWEPLCKFLDVPIPNEPFPKENDSEATRELYIGQMAFGLFHYAMYILAATSAAMGVYCVLFPEVPKAWALRGSEVLYDFAGRVGLR